MHTSSARLIASATDTGLAGSGYGYGDSNGSLAAGVDMNFGSGAEASSLADWLPTK